MAALLAPHAGRTCNVTALLAHMMTPMDGHADATLQLMLVLLRSARLEILSSVCRAMVEANHGARISFLLVKIIRMDCNHAKRVSALLLYMIHEDHMAASVHLLTIMLADKADDDAAMVLMHMLASGGVPETGALGAALVDAGAALLEIVKIMEATAAEDMIDEIARWIGILIRSGHARAWADIAGALHCRNRYWIAADIMEALIPYGSIAVEAQNIIWTHLAAVLNDQAQLVLEDRADIVARKMVYLIEKGRADLAARLNDALIHDRRFKESAKLAVALSSMMPVLPLLDCLRDAGARVAPEALYKLQLSQVP
ncbi:hypothetical protein CVIRNUC_000350 [Coccomyxa viridis]|uniref:Uncharacterized protein n=1 Tax=Coccomyxa viridis TaxID=1274662 RepID=A0AAV1HR41_9CHLO|nr:hypothetical protein CVIRNUC_000350 [Coccomyxa viridis]